MSPVSIQTQAFISYCSPVQGRTAGASTGVYEFGSVVSGQYAYKSAWTSLTDKYIMWENGNKCDEYAAKQSTI